MQTTSVSEAARMASALGKLTMRPKDSRRTFRRLLVLFACHCRPVHAPHVRPTILIILTAIQLCLRLIGPVENVHFVAPRRLDPRCLAAHLSEHRDNMGLYHCELSTRAENLLPLCQKRLFGMVDAMSTLLHLLLEEVKRLGLRLVKLLFLLGLPSDFLSLPCQFTLLCLQIRQAACSLSLGVGLAALQHLLLGLKLRLLLLELTGAALVFALHALRGKLLLFALLEHKVALALQLLLQRLQLLRSPLLFI
mmetsp:Transcript_27304/g.48711  ORF Transcript_27304/g.48711 Transcript_27304/m.48711 type:complete len:251 (-) Transcript_27304:1156-1908(-)